jgi:hypothetical protein
MVADSACRVRQSAGVSEEGVQPLRGTACLQGMFTGVQDRAWRSDLRRPSERAAAGRLPTVAWRGPLLERFLDVLPGAQEFQVGRQVRAPGERISRRATGDSGQKDRAPEIQREGAWTHGSGGDPVQECGVEFRPQP